MSAGAAGLALQVLADTAPPLSAARTAPATDSALARNAGHTHHAPAHNQALHRDVLPAFGHPRTLSGTVHADSPRASGSA
ncbi:MAG: hypothetical protein NZ739_09875, partial [Verrucomicrobiae bacterium]|nr:hypothetical protein [Verrucomicrobiae bacterium]